MYFVFLFNIRFIFYDQHFFYDSHTVPRLWGWLRPQFYSFLNVLLWGVGVQQRCGVQAGVLQSWQAQARRNYKGECKTRYHSPHLVQIGHVRIQFQRKHRILWRLLMRTVHSEPPLSFPPSSSSTHSRNFPFRRKPARHATIELRGFFI